MRFPFQDLCLLAIFGLLLMSLPARAELGPLPVIDISHLQHQLIRAPAQWLVTDADKTLTDVRGLNFVPLTAGDLNQGITGQTFWLRFRLSNQGAEQAQSWVLHQESTYLDNLTFYFADNGGDVRHLALSDRKPFQDRALDFRKLALLHETPARGYTDLYLRLNFDQADSISLNFHLWEEARFHRAVKDENLFQGAYFGIMLTMLVIALVLTLVLRQASYLYYGAFLLCSMVMWALLNGYAYRYLWPNSVFWHNEGFHIVYLLFAVTALQFSKAFLRTQRFLPKTHRVLGMLQVAMLLCILLRFLGVYEAVLHLAFGSLALLVLLPLLGWLAYRKGLKYARWYALAWLIYSISLMMSLISAYSNLLHWGMEPLAYAQVGGLVEAVLLLVALAERLIGWDMDRRRALQLANQDPLTGLGNRRLLTQQYEAFKARFVQNALPVFLIMIDLDHFKRANDTYGHDAGDQILRELAQLLRRLSRSEDVCIRYGGEEFAVLLQVPSAAAALQIAERIRLEFAGYTTMYEGKAIEHTLSIGLTAVLSDCEQLSASEMMIRADAALYQAKAAGRNRVTLYDQVLVQRGNLHGCGETGH